MSPQALKDDPLKLMGLGFGLTLLILGVIWFIWYREDPGLRRQEMQVVGECEGKYRDKYPDQQVSFLSVYAERFGSTHIIVTGTMAIPDADGHTRTDQVNCDVDIASTPWVWQIH
ncbi:MAG TPA: hypothetical protein VL625_00075 [Patescibacteria group bacterium]|nr:hypothetical protein [Patescibacteria group bacterium]